MLSAGAFLSRTDHARTGIDGIDVKAARRKGGCEEARPTADFENSRPSRHTEVVDEPQGSHTSLLVDQGENVGMAVDVVPKINVVIKVRRHDVLGMSGAPDFSHKPTLLPHSSALCRLNDSSGNLHFACDGSSRVTGCKRSFSSLRFGRGGRGSRLIGRGLRHGWGACSHHA